MKKNKFSRIYMITALILFIFAISGLVFGIILPRTNLDNTKIIDSPRVSTFITSSDDEQHVLNADVSIKIAKNSASKFNQNELKSLIASSISNLDYTKITEKDGVVYVSEEIEKILLEHYSSEDVEDIYVTSFISDDELPEDGSLSSENPWSNVNPGLRGLFQKK